VLGNTKGMKNNVGFDVMYGERRGQSQKPEALYELIEELVPNGIF
jgi:mRNA (2'-O-methyladenosine-N6-)-methyltransferase